MWRKPLLVVILVTFKQSFSVPVLTDTDTNDTPQNGRKSNDPNATHPGHLELKPTFNIDILNSHFLGSQPKSASKHEILDIPLPAHLAGLKPQGAAHQVNDVTLPEVFGPTGFHWGEPSGQEHNPLWHLDGTLSSGHGKSELGSVADKTSTAQSVDHFPNDTGLRQNNTDGVNQVHHNGRDVPLPENMGVAVHPNGITNVETAKQSNDVNGVAQPIGIGQGVHPINFDSKTPPIDFGPGAQPIDFGLTVQPFDFGPEVHAIDISSKAQPIDFSSAGQPINISSKAQPIDFGSAVQPIDISSKAQSADFGSVVQPLDTDSVAQPIDLSSNANPVDTYPFLVDMSPNDTLALNSENHKENSSQMIDVPLPENIGQAVHPSNVGQITHSNNLNEADHRSGVRNENIAPSVHPVGTGSAVHHSEVMHPPLGTNFGTHNANSATNNFANFIGTEGSSPQKPLDIIVDNHAHDVGSGLEHSIGIGAQPPQNIALPIIPAKNSDSPDSIKSQSNAAFGIVPPSNVKALDNDHESHAHDILTNNDHMQNETKPFSGNDPFNVKGEVSSPQNADSNTANENHNIITKVVQSNDPFDTGAAIDITGKNLDQAHAHFIDFWLQNPDAMLTDEFGPPIPFEPFEPITTTTVPTTTVFNANTNHGTHDHHDNGHHDVNGDCEGVVRDADGVITHIIDVHDCSLLPVIQSEITGGHAIDPHNKELLLALDSQNFAKPNNKNNARNQRQQTTTILNTVPNTKLTTTTQAPMTRRQTTVAPTTATVLVKSELSISEIRAQLRRAKQKQRKERLLAIKKQKQLQAQKRRMERKRAQEERIKKRQEARREQARKRKEARLAQLKRQADRKKKMAEQRRKQKQAAAQRAKQRKQANKRKQQQKIIKKRNQQRKLQARRRAQLMQKKRKENKNFRLKKPLTQPRARNQDRQTKTVTENLEDDSPAKSSVLAFLQKRRQDKRDRLRHYAG